MQEQATAVLTGLASGSQSNKDAVVTADALPVLISLLLSDQPLVQTQALWANRNIASGSQHIHKTIVMAGAMPALVRLLQYCNTDLTFCKVVTTPTLKAHQRCCTYANQLLLVTVILRKQEAMRVSVSLSHSLCLWRGSCHVPGTTLCCITACNPNTVNYVSAHGWGRLYQH